jgi:hypothetical protein
MIFPDWLHLRNSLHFGSLCIRFWWKDCGLGVQEAVVIGVQHQKSLYRFWQEHCAALYLRKCKLKPIIYFRFLVFLAHVLPGQPVSHPRDPVVRPHHRHPPADHCGRERAHRRLHRPRRTIWRNSIGNGNHFRTGKE